MTPLQTFRMVAGEFKGIPDETVSNWISLATSLVSEKRFKSSYTLALALMAAHKMKMSGLGSQQSWSPEMLNVASYKEADVEIAFNNTQKDAKDPDGEFSLTTYGIQYLSLRRARTVPILSAGMCNG